MRCWTSLLRASAVLATVVVVGAGAQLSEVTTAHAATPPPASTPAAPAPGPLASPFVGARSVASSAVASLASLERPADAPAWAVSLTADNTDITEGQQATLTAYASQPVDGSGLDIMIWGFADSFAIPKLVANCSDGSSCAAQVGWDPDPVSYEAFVIAPDFESTLGQMFAGAAATSDQVTIPSTGGGSGGPQPWSVSLMVSPTLLPIGKQVTVVAIANQTVAGTPYEVEIFSLDSGRRVANCGESNGCTVTVPWNPNTQTYVAFVAEPGKAIPQGPVAQSNTVTVTGLDWQVALGTTSQKSMTAIAVANRAVGSASSAYIMVWDATTRTALATCYSGTSCKATVPHKGDMVFAFIVPFGKTDPYGVYLARSQAVTFPVSLDGNGASQNNDGQPCACDPINPLNGTLHETVNDIAVEGRGPGLALTRTYDSNFADVAGRFGFGWADGYATHLMSGPNDDGTLPTSLATATTVEVVQQDGSSVPFTEHADGTFTADPSVLATLTHNADGTYTFVQRKKSVFTFDSYGTLTGVADLHGNTTQLGYDDFGRLSTVTDPAGRSLTYAYNDSGQVSSVTGPGGRSETYGYDAGGNLVSATDESGATRHYGYDALHDLTSMTDPDGRTTTNTFDAAGRVVAQTDGRGATTSLSYDDEKSTTTMRHPGGDVTALVYTQGFLTSRTEGTGADARTWSYLYDPNTYGLAQLTDPDGHVTHYAYDGDGNLTSITDANEHTSSATFDALGDQTSSTDADGAVTTMTYDAQGDLLAKKDPTGATASYTYNAHGEPTSATNADGHTSSMTYDDAGDLTSVIDPTGTSTTMAYDGLGEVTSATDPLRRTTTYAYDARGLRTSVTDAAGGTTTYAYDAAGQLTSMTDPTDRTWTYAYEGAGNLVRTTNPDGTFTVTTYDADGRKSTIADAQGNTTKFAYDATGRLISTADPTGATIGYAYDPAGLLISTTSARGGVTRYSYDAAGETTSVTDAAGGVSQYAYDPAGRTTTTTDPAGAVTKYGYDADGRAIDVTDADGGIERNAFDPAGLQVSYTDANGQPTSYSYDSDGRRVSSTDADGHVTTFGYDAASQLLTTTDAAGRVTSDSYDPAGRLVGIAYSDGTTPGVRYAFDSAGRRLSMTDGTGTTTYSYDAAGRLVSVVDGSGQEVGYGYDALGRIDTITYPDGRVVGQTYDAAGRVATTSDGSGNTTSYTYDGDGNLVATTYPNGVVQQQVYDPANRMTSTNVNAAGSTLASFDYQVSPTGLATSVHVGGTAGVTPNSQSYGYDPSSRLTSVATSSAGASTAPTGSFHYDAAGNVIGLPDGTSLGYDAASQLTSSVGPGSITTTYGFDATGDRTSATTGGLTSSYSYDQAGELSRVAVPSRSPYGLMAGGWFFSLAVRGDGSVHAWGDNSFGELGDGGACGATCPNQLTVPGLPTIVQVAAGTYHALAVSTDGRVFAWGAGDRGQLGNASNTSSSTPVQVKGLSGVVMVAAAGDTSYALTGDGRVFAWGGGDAGQLGNGSTADSSTPVQVRALPDIVDIAANAIPGEAGHALAVSADGHVYAWGNDDKHPDVDTTDTGSSSGSGSGSGSPASGPCPSKTDNGKGNGGVPGNGGHSNGGSECTTKTDNGRGNGGTPGNGNGAVHRGSALLPALVTGVDDVVQVAAGGWSSYALRADGSAWSWGDDSYGELGLSDPPNVKDVDTPTPIVGLPALKMLAAGGVHALALTTRGQVYAWGDDNAGQVGQPGADCREADKVCPSPQLVAGVTADAVAAGYVHSLISTVHETVLGLGRDAEGQLGDGYTDPATQVSAAGDRNGQDAPASGGGGAKSALTRVTGLAQVRPQAPVAATYTYNGDGLRATSVTTLDDTTTTVPATTRATFAWDTTTDTASLLSDGAYDYITGPAGIIEQTGAPGSAGPAGTVFLHPDRLGSTRLLTDATGQPVATLDYTPTGQTTQADGLNLLPYAQAIPPRQAATSIGYAGAYTDPGTGALYLQHRYDDPTTDQFLTLDPAVSLTREPYSYAGDNPANNTDPSGLKWCALGHNPNGSCRGGHQYTNAVEKYDPMYTAINGYYNEWQAAEHGCSLSTVFKYGTQAVAGVAGTVGMAVGGAGAISQVLDTPGIEAAAEDSTTLYRAVDPNELADVRATGQFRAGGPSMSGKFFAENPEDAAQWGQTLNGGQGAVVGTRVPSSFADQLMRWEKLDGIGPARYVDESQLSEFNRLLSGIWEVP